MVVTGRQFRLTAVLVGVVLALTGFSSTGGSGGKSKSKSSGGGCSSSKSKSKKKSYSGTGNSGSGSTATATPTATRPLAQAVVVNCVGPAGVKAVVEVTSKASAEYTFRVPLVFEGASGRVDSGSADLTLKAGETRRIDVPMTSPAKAGEVQRCVVGEVQTLSSSSPTPTSTSGSGSTGSVTTTGGSGGKTTSTPKPRSTKKTR
ncbi:hypothetical protein [Streptomyces sp. TBY4]|uniref:hypothetical protein n=1 Tax=Streptomyces sp. TBY4 TaxID=2962030 RepID=UPI0020B6FD06|nr:hypothetical protein [Streptomyces sp. TBY4]MCP3759573.1 hypothetical protein [Streptomyces sp. TBY4]